jgi:hypothetical protein
MMSPTNVPAGILFPNEWLQSEWFAVWASFVALNTLVYVALAISKMLPKVHVSDVWYHLRGLNRRTETRSIYPDGRGYPGAAQRPST